MYANEPANIDANLFQNIIEFVASDLPKAITETEITNIESLKVGLEKDQVELEATGV